MSAQELANFIGFWEPTVRVRRVTDQPVINYAAGQAKRPPGHSYGVYARVEDGMLRQYVSAASFPAPMRTGILACLLKFLLIFTHCLRSGNLDGLCNNVWIGLLN
ncbi:hypothetical protein CDAR_431641 [Caerostris darwini]|uniref:Uncharacterized protein n=1 Tax=Caerostris darwini TaxID=1538125 RepID=A0AAV4SXM4_9ARAC|nr:hypothetical protein CDAR_431641 [Caerostris darwini]